jgi:2-polyprenyl-3-methyl-5-hydroxy-6-metoxy-1,4-benzoquinol methylase
VSPDLHPFSPFYGEPRPAEPLWKIGEFQIVRCRDSGLVYLANPLSAEALTEFYSNAYFEGESSRKGYASYSADEFILRKNFASLLRHVCTDARQCGLDPRSLTLLDQGCAHGFFLDEARHQFASVTGTEINPEVAAIGRERFGLEVHAGESAIESIANASRSVVTMWDVIEHLREPRAVLQQCHRVLEPGGLIHITTGDIDSVLARVLGRRWRLINPPQHISYFSIRTLKSLLRDLGFEILHAKRCGKHVSLQFMAFIASYLLGRRRSATLPPWLARRSLYINLRDVMLICARKPN